MEQRNMSSGKGKIKTESQEIDGIEITPDVLTDRAGVHFFARYYENSWLPFFLEQDFGRLRKSRKGCGVAAVFKQLCCFFFDGTSRHLSYFDTLREDPAYARLLNLARSEVLSSHGVKRFFNKFYPCITWKFRSLLQEQFLWRLNHEKPPVIMLHLDTMVMDNDDADCREGVKPTYKKVKGFQPLQLSWDSFIVDAVFRGGNKHSNDGDTAEKMLKKIIGMIRQCYSENVPVIICMDSGFYDDSLFRSIEECPGAGYICAGKLYRDISGKMGGLAETELDRYEKGRSVWGYREFSEKRDSWSVTRRGIYTRQLVEEGQGLLALGGETERVIVTNIGLGSELDKILRGQEYGHLLETESIIETNHGRGKSELVWRSLKEFADQKLPFRKFLPNMAFYYTMIMAYNLFVAFRTDVLGGVVEATAYPDTVRRAVVDTAAKIVRHGGRIILKFSQFTWDKIRAWNLWLRSASPPEFTVSG